MDKALLSLIEDFYNLDIDCADCAEFLREQGYGDFNWAKVADIYQEIYCQQEGK